jgi:hypothetical protein
MRDTGQRTRATCGPFLQACAVANSLEDGNALDKPRFAGVQEFAASRRRNQRQRLASSVEGSKKLHMRAYLCQVSLFQHTSTNSLNSSILAEMMKGQKSEQHAAPYLLREKCLGAIELALDGNAKTAQIAVDALQV